MANSGNSASTWINYCTSVLRGRLCDLLLPSNMGTRSIDWLEVAALDYLSSPLSME